jgi:hypothetical protein
MGSTRGQEKMPASENHASEGFLGALIRVTRLETTESYCPANRLALTIALAGSARCHRSAIGRASAVSAATAAATSPGRARV